MRIHLTFLVPVFVLGGVGVFAQVARGPDVSARAETAATAASFAVVDETPAYTYVGSSKCKKCHITESKSWKKTRMGKAFETLKPGVAAEAKTKHGLDPAKDYTTDVTCLKCHTTGFGHEGGYAIPDPNDKKAVRKAKKLAGAGCESCHGPGSAYIKVFEDIFRSKRKYKIEELYAVGLKKIDGTGCKTCHNSEGPTAGDGYHFDFDKKKDEDTHERKELKQREG